MISGLSAKLILDVPLSCPFPLSHWNVLFTFLLRAYTSKNSSMNEKAGNELDLVGEVQFSY